MDEPEERGAGSLPTSIPPSEEAKIIRERAAQALSLRLEALKAAAAASSSSSSSASPFPSS